MKTINAVIPNTIVQLFFFLGLGIWNLGLGTSFAQDEDQSEKDCTTIENKMAIKLYKKAEKETGKNTGKAIHLLKEAIEIEPDFADAYYKLARIAMTNESYLTAKKNFLKVLDICPTYNVYIHFYLGQIYYGSNEFSKAARHLEKFMKNPDAIKSDRHYNTAESFLSDAVFYSKLLEHPVPFEPVNLSGICTQQDEYLPYLTADNETAYFTRKYQKLAMGDLYPKSAEEFTHSNRVNGNFTAGTPMTAPFNRGNNEGGACLTIDNLHMYFTSCKTLTNGYNNCDLYSADYVNIDDNSLLDKAFMAEAMNMTEQEVNFEVDKMKEKGVGNMWANIKPLGDLINGLNSWESQPTVSSDGNTLYFASNRPGGIGGIDLYKTVRDSAGNWGAPDNLGPLINTTGNEKSPFMHPDRKTLYFSSDGIRGLGGYDVFFAKLIKTDAGYKWEKPENLGYPINSKEDDLGFFVSTDGETGYFSSNNNTEHFRSKGGWDVYSFPLYDSARPAEVLFIKGELKDGSGNALPDASMEIANVRTKEIIKVNVDSSSGKYAAVITLEKEKKDEFVVSVNKDNYAYTSKLVTAPAIKKDKNARDFSPVTKLDFEMKEVSVGEPYLLNNINFATNSSSVLTSTAMVALDGFVSYLKKNPDMRVDIHGHTDDVGSDKDNLELSASRAKAVFAYLVLSGIDKNRLSDKGFGESHPIASNVTEEGREHNRRTEFVIVSF